MLERCSRDAPGQLHGAPARPADAARIRIAHDGRHRRTRDASCARCSSGSAIPTTGAALVRDVVFVDDVDPGPAAGDFVDVLVEWETAGPITAARVDGSTSIRRRPPRDRSGNHDGGGWFVAAGPRLAPVVLEHTPRIVDLGPTVAARLGVGLDGVDGEPIAELAGPV